MAKINKNANDQIRKLQHDVQVLEKQNSGHIATVAVKDSKISEQGNLIHRKNLEIIKLLTHIKELKSRSLLERIFQKHE